MKLCVTIIMSVALALVAICSYAQPPQQSRAEYDALLGSELKLKATLDSVQNLIAQNRKLFEQEPSKGEELGEEIVRLEGELFELRSRLGKVGQQLAAMEVQMETSAVQQVNTPIRNLFANDFFANNLSKKDISILSSAGKVQAQVTAIKQDVDALYEQLGALKLQYDGATDQQTVDDVIQRAAMLKEQLKAADSRMLETWGYLYNYKIDTYLLLADKLSNVDRSKMEQIDEQGREVRRMEAFAGQGLAPNMSTYPAQRQYALNYEMMLASSLALKAASDSLINEQAKLPKNFPAYENIPFEPRSLIVYAPITLGNTYPYESLSQVPPIILPQTGVYYAVQVALTNGPASALTIFKGAQPLQLEQLPNGQMRYVLGGFRTAKEVEAAVSQMYKAGFRAPVAVAWIDGQPTTLAKAKAYQAKQPVEAVGEGYKVVIITKNTELAAMLREVVNMHAKDKDISRLAQNDGSLVFTIFPFTNKDEAQVIAQIIRTKEDTDVAVEQIN